MEPEALSTKEIQVLLALISLKETKGRMTLREVASLAGLGLSTTHRYLRDLRRKGWVDWQDGTVGTLRPLATHVPVRRTKVA